MTISPAESLDEVGSPDISQLVIEDDTPVDNIFTETQQRLLCDCLYSSWFHPDSRIFLAAANVGVFYAIGQPPLVPDVFLSLVCRPPRLAPEEEPHLLHLGVW